MIASRGRSSLLSPHSSFALVYNSTPSIPSRHHPVVAVRGIQAGGTSAVHGGGAAVVDQQRHLEVAVVLVDQRPKIAKPDAKVRFAIVQLLLRDTLLEEAGGRGHELREADGTHGTRRPFIELTLYANQTKREIRLQPLGQRDIVDRRRDVRGDAIARGIGEDLVGAVELGLR